MNISRNDIDLSDHYAQLQRDWDAQQHQRAAAENERRQRERALVYDPETAAFGPANGTQDDFHRAASSDHAAPERHDIQPSAARLAEMEAAYANAQHFHRPSSNDAHHDDTDSAPTQEQITQPEQRRDRHDADALDAEAQRRKTEQQPPRRVTSESVVGRGELSQERPTPVASAISEDAPHLEDTDAALKDALARRVTERERLARMEHEYGSALRRVATFFTVSSKKRMRAYQELHQQRDTYRDALNTVHRLRAAQALAAPESRKEHMIALINKDILNEANRLYDATTRARAQRTAMAPHLERVGRWLRTDTVQRAMVAGGMIMSIHVGSVMGVLRAAPRFAIALGAKGPIVLKAAALAGYVGAAAAGMATGRVVGGATHRVLEKSLERSNAATLRHLTRMSSDAWNHYDVAALITDRMKNKDRAAKTEKAVKYLTTALATTGVVYLTGEWARLVHDGAIGDTPSTAGPSSQLPVKNSVPAAAMQPSHETVEALAAAETQTVAPPPPPDDVSTTVFTPRTPSPEPVSFVTTDAHTDGDTPQVAQEFVAQEPDVPDTERFAAMARKELAEAQFADVASVTEAQITQGQFFGFGPRDVAFHDFLEHKTVFNLVEDARNAVAHDTWESLSDARRRAGAWIIMATQEVPPTDGETVGQYINRFLHDPKGQMFEYERMREAFPTRVESVTNQLADTLFGGRFTTESQELYAGRMFAVPRPVVERIAMEVGITQIDHATVETVLKRIIGSGYAQAVLDFARPTQ